MSQGPGNHVTTPKTFEHGLKSLFTLWLSEKAASRLPVTTMRENYEMITKLLVSAAIGAGVALAVAAPVSADHVTSPSVFGSGPIGSAPKAPPPENAPDQINAAFSAALAAVQALPQPLPQPGQ